MFGDMIIIFMGGASMIWMLMMDIEPHPSGQYCILPPEPPTPDPRIDAPQVRVELTPEQIEKATQEDWMDRFRVECGDPNKYLTPEEKLRNETYKPGGM